MSLSLDNIAQQLERIDGVESASVTPYGTVSVILSKAYDRPLREDILEIGRDFLIPIQVFYRMPDGAVVGENKKKLPETWNEWVDEFYKPVNIPGFLGTDSNAPPEKVSKSVDGGKMLQRVRASTRGKPVIAWRYGDMEVKPGTIIKFNKETSLQWTMGRMLSVKPGAMATVDELSSRRPIAFIRVGEFNNVELPVHMMSHFFDIMPNYDVKKEDKDANGSSRNAKINRSKERAAANQDPEMAKVVRAIGVGAIGWGRDPEADDNATNPPFNRDQWIARSDDTIDDDIDVDIDTMTLAEAKELADSEDDMLMKHPPRQKRAFLHNKPVILGKKY
jgi:hypothetical protein